MSWSWCVNTCVYVSTCVCVCACGSSMGRAEKYFASHLQTVPFAAGPADGRRAGGAERRHTASKKYDPRTCPAPTATRRREGDEGDFSIGRCLTLSAVQTREELMLPKTLTQHHHPPSLLLGVENQKMCHKLQNNQ